MLYMYTPDCFASSSKALGRLTVLQQLEIIVQSRPWPVALTALCHLSALTRLERLVVRPHPATDELPPDLLPALGSLTSLNLVLLLDSTQSVAWQRPDGSGPALRQLRLAGCRIGLLPDRLLHALRQLERLELYGVALQKGQLDILPQLPHLTSLTPAFTDAVPWPIVLRCTGLRELNLKYPPNPAPANLPAGSLPQLTRLTVACAHAGPAWLALPQLRSLLLTSGGRMCVLEKLCFPWRRGALPPTLGQCLQLEELEVWNHSLWNVTRVASSLTRLTSLVVAAGRNITGPQARLVCYNAAWPRLPPTSSTTPFRARLLRPCWDRPGRGRQNDLSKVISRSLILPCHFRKPSPAASATPAPSHPVMQPPHVALSINDLPPAVLARILAFTDPRRDGLALLLTCRHWLGVLEVECPQHVWGLVEVQGARILEQDVQAALLAGLRRRAAGLTELALDVQRAAALLPLWPALLDAATAAPGLRSLELFMPHSDPDQHEPICEALARLTALHRLSVTLWTSATFPCSAFRHFSTLTRLEHLKLDLPEAAGELPPGLLPPLGGLTCLHLQLNGHPTVEWQRPDGSGPMLRQLRLDSCRIGLPSDRLLPALRQLEWLALYCVPLEEGQLSVLPQLPHLTTLGLGDCGVDPWPAVLRCAGLRELTVNPEDPPPTHLPPGTFPQLTWLEIPCQHASPAWLALPQLRRLELRYVWDSGALPPTLGRCLQLEELDVDGCSLLEITQAVSSLTRLTRLVVTTDEYNAAAVRLHEGPYLAGLRQLDHGSCYAPEGAPTWHLPVHHLAAATSLELLDLGRDRNLRLRGDEVAGLLRALPRLRRVVLPFRKGDGAAAAAVERIREGLWEGTGVGTGPSHAVEVECEAM